jgi:FKBP-type peptidyl-prolyl cis-trans isomerase FkpA
MTEITRVPLQPIGKGSLTKMWVGIAALVLAGGGIAYAALPAAVKIQTIKAGTGPSPTDDDVALISYKGTLPDGRVFDQSAQYLSVPGRDIPGMTRAIEKMQVGGRYHVVIPPSLAYGDKQTGPIPPNTPLNFDIALLDYKSRAEVEAQQRLMQQLQQMQQQQGGGGAAAGGPPAPGAVPEGAPGASAPTQP